VFLLLVGTAGSGASVRVIGKLTQERASRPGDEYSHTITLANDGVRSTEVRLYLRDYSFQSDGSNHYGDPGGDARSNAAWVRLPSEVVTVPPESEIEVPIWVSVPRTGELGGTYWSVLMVEPVPARDLTDPTQSRDGVEVRALMRYGVQIVTEIPGGSGQLEFFAPELIEENGEWVFTVDVRNTGNQWLRPTFRLELFDTAGKPAGRFEDSRKRIFPGSSVRFRTAVGPLASGARYHALAVADSGREELFGLTIDLAVR
jgi:hypothetical protein